MASGFFLLVLLSLMSLPKDWHLVFIFYYIIIISRDCPQTGYCADWLLVVLHCYPLMFGLVC
jgi:hypothetical protein